MKVQNSQNFHAFLPILMRLSKHALNIQCLFEFELNLNLFFIFFIFHMLGLFNIIETSIVLFVIVYSQFIQINLNMSMTFPWSGSKYRVVQKKPRTTYFPQYVDAITGISVWGNFSWENLPRLDSINFINAHSWHQKPARNNAHWQS